MMGRAHGWSVVWGLGTAGVAGVVASACANNPPPEVASMPPGVHTDVKTVYYEVNPLVAAQFRQAMDDQGLRHGNGALAVGQSHIGVTSAYDRVPTANGCIVSHVRVLVRSQITIPHWEPPPSVDPVIASAWREYVSKITEHERTHVEISEKRGQKLDHALEGLSAASCPELATKEAELEERLKDEEQAEQKEFDRQQGPAVWPYAREP